MEPGITVAYGTKGLSCEYVLYRNWAIILRQERCWITVACRTKGLASECVASVMQHYGTGLML